MNEAPISWKGPAESPPNLSGQQMQALANQHKTALIAIKHDVELRKWAVDQACGLVGAQVEADLERQIDVVTLSREIHAFLVEGATEHPPGSVST